jgi:signal transduction histidine kinase
MFRTVTFRLVLWYAVLFVMSSIVVFLFAYFTLTHSLQHRVDESLLNSADEFETIYRKEGLDALQSDFKIEAESEGLGRVFFRLLSPHMTVLASSDLSRWKGLDTFTAEVLDNTRVFKTLNLPSHPDKARVLFKKITGGNILQIGYTLREDQKLMAKYIQIFGTVIMLLAASGVIVAWFLTRRAMSGVERVTETATRIAGGDLTHRVPLANEGEEIDSLARAFNNMLERIQVLVSELKEVTNNIAHDLRSPLSRMRGIAEASITGEQHIGEYRDMAVMVIEESDRLVGMINTMLEIAETESGIAALSMNPLDMLDIVKDVYELFLPVAEDEGIHLEIEVPSEKLIVHGDLPRLQRVMANLLDNALKYTPEGGRVLITAKGDRSHVMVSIADSGIGIAEGDLEHIFERFFRQDRSRSQPGNGLGLTLARTFVRAHGGDISVKSHPGKGSTFTVILPRTPGSCTHPS